MSYLWISNLPTTRSSVWLKFLIPAEAGIQQQIFLGALKPFKLHKRREKKDECILNQTKKKKISFIFPGELNYIGLHPVVRINKQSLTSFRLAAVLAGRTFAQKRSNLLAVPFPSSFPVSSVPLLLGDTVFFTSMFFSPCFIVLINKLSLVPLHQGCLHKIHIYGLGLNNTWTKDRKTRAKKSPLSPIGWLRVQALAISAVAEPRWPLPWASSPLHPSAATGHAPCRKWDTKIIDCKVIRSLGIFKELCTTIGVSSNLKMAYFNAEIKSARGSAAHLRLPKETDHMVTAGIYMV